MAITAALCGCSEEEGSTQVAPTCDFGKPIREQVVLRPRSGTFYSVDVLNPDVVKLGRRYLLLFSGNSARTEAGSWHTGLAVSRRPDGPFRVKRGVREDFLNGGTALYRGRLLHGATVPARREPVLFASRQGEDWREVESMPAGKPSSWRFFQTDLSLYPRRGGVEVYYAGRIGTTGADIGVAWWSGGDWRGFRRVLTRKAGSWDGLDLGEPTVFTIGKREYMLYAGLGQSGAPRSVGLARREGDRWIRCGTSPFISAGRGWYRGNAIDPEPLVVKDRLFVYFGGGLGSSLGGNMRGSIGLRVYRLPG
jgi:hypothetical protein